MTDTVNYAIPSRARADVVAAKTLPLLLRLGVDPDRVTVFVAEPELDAYAETIADFGCLLAVGAEGMAAQRHAILDAYPAGARIISIDDDIRDLAIRAGEKRLVDVSPWEWDTIVAEAYQVCETVGARLWGLYPVPNPFFMKPRIRTDLSYIGGGLFGVINDGLRSPLSPLWVALEDKEDFERSIRCYLADGAVVRVDYVTWRTEGYRGAGGMQADGHRTAERIDASARELALRFPELCSLNLTKKSGKTELRLRDRREAAA